MRASARVDGCAGTRAPAGARPSRPEGQEALHGRRKFWAPRFGRPFLGCLERLARPEAPWRPPVARWALRTRMWTETRANATIADSPRPLAEELDELEPQLREIDAFGSSRCVDVSSECTAWVAAGECLSNRQAMQLACARSCTLCDDKTDHANAEGAEGGVTAAGAPLPQQPRGLAQPPRGLAQQPPGMAEQRASCRDLDPSCDERARHGECIRDPLALRVTCPRACGACESIPPWALVDVSAGIGGTPDALARGASYRPNPLPHAAHRRRNLFRDIDSRRLDGRFQVTAWVRISLAMNVIFASLLLALVLIRWWRCEKWLTRSCCPGGGGSRAPANRRSPRSSANASTRASANASARASAHGTPRKAPTRPRSLPMTPRGGHWLEAPFSPRETAAGTTAAGTTAAGTGTGSASASMGSTSRRGSRTPSGRGSRTPSGIPPAYFARESPLLPASLEREPEPMGGCLGDGYIGDLEGGQYGGGANVCRGPRGEPWLLPPPPPPRRGAGASTPPSAPDGATPFGVDDVPAAADGATLPRRVFTPLLPLEPPMLTRSMPPSPSSAEPT